MNAPNREKLNFTTKLAYGAGDLGPAMTANVLVFFLLYFFTNVAGLPAGLAGSILAIGKISDAINDPIAGILSDRTRTRWGRRLPWMLAGAIPFGILFFLQWIIPRLSDSDTVNNWWLFGYYVLIGILFNLAYTVVNLPYTALTPELTQDYNERTSLNSYRFAFSIGGSILTLILAGFIFSQFPDNPARQYWVLGLVSSIFSVIALLWCALRIQERGRQPILQPQQKKGVGTVLGIIGAAAVVYGLLRTLPITAPLVESSGADFFGTLALLIGLEIALFGVTLLRATPEPHLSDHHATARLAQAQPTIGFSEQLKIVFSNRPFLYIIGIYLCSWLAVQLTASILIYFVVSWMGLPEGAFPQAAIAVQGTALVMLFFWKAVSDRVGKRAVYFMGTGIWIVAQAFLFLIQPGQVGLMYLGAVMAGFGVAVAYLVPWSMVPDVIELDELQTGQRREGIFYGFMVLLQKLGLAIALFLVGQVLEFAGFIERPPGGEIPVQPDSALLAIRLAVGPLPSIILVAGVVLAYFYPITRAVHDEILLKLKERETQ
ncbi:MAG: MFS transporter [Cyanophyceae cyanobacterium]